MHGTNMKNTVTFVEYTSGGGQGPPKPWCNLISVFLSTQRRHHSGTTYLVTITDRNNTKWFIWIFRHSSWELSHLTNRQHCNNMIQTSVGVLQILRHLLSKYLLYSIFRVYYYTYKIRVSTVLSLPLAEIGRFKFPSCALGYRIACYSTVQSIMWLWTFRKTMLPPIFIFRIKPASSGFNLDDRNIRLIRKVVIHLPKYTVS